MYESSDQHIDNQISDRRSASYAERTGECLLSEVDRFSSAALLTAAPNSLYMESNCVEDMGRLCDFREVRGRILKTVDSVLEDVRSREQCRELCASAASATDGSSFRCHTYDWGDTGPGVCRLSHHTAASLRLVPGSRIGPRGVQAESGGPRWAQV